MEKDGVRRPRFIDEFRGYLDRIINNEETYTKKEYEIHEKKLNDFLKTVYKENFRKLKKYSDEHIACQIFEKEESASRIKYELFAQIISFERMSKRLRSIDIERADSRINIDSGVKLIRDLITDIITYLGSKKLKYQNKIINFGIYSGNTLLLSNQIYSASIKLFGEVINPASFDITAIKYTSIFLLRQAIELRIMNALGVVEIKKESDTPIRYKFTDILNFIEDNQTDSQFQSIIRQGAKKYENGRPPLGKRVDTSARGLSAHSG
jgi:hypothetical protein